MVYNRLLYWNHCYSLYMRMTCPVLSMKISYCMRTILVSDKHANTIEARFWTALETVSVWLIDNQLSLHLGKTESILFGTKRKLSNCSALNKSCNGTNIESTSLVKYLRATIDNSLSGDAIALSIVGYNSYIEMLSFWTGVLNECEHRL